MHHLKSFIITLLFTSFSTPTIIGKSISTSTKIVTPPTPPQKKEPQKTPANLPAQTFKQLHDHIAAMKPEEVISDEIFNHIIKQLPDDIPDKKIIRAQVRAIIDSYFE